MRPNPIMHRVVTFDPRTLEEQVYPYHNAFYDVEMAEQFALYMLGQNETELIVSLLEVQAAICKHCGKPLYEKPGWITHRWIHIDNDAHTCFLPHLPKGEPKE